MTRLPKNARTAKESAARRARAARAQTLHDSAIVESCASFYTLLARRRVQDDLLELIEAHETISRDLAIRSGNFSFETDRAALLAFRNELKAYFEGRDDLPF